GLSLLSLEQVIQPAHAIPAIAIGLQANTMLAILADPAVILAQQIDQQISGAVFEAFRELDLAWFFRKIVKKQNRIVAPVVPDPEHRPVAGLKDFEFAPAYFRDLLAHADDALDPVHHRLRITPLVGSVDVLKAIRSIVDDAYDRFAAFSESAIRL